MADQVTEVTQVNQVAELKVPSGPPHPSGFPPSKCQAQTPGGESTGFRPMEPGEMPAPMAGAKESANEPEVVAAPVSPVVSSGLVEGG